MKIYFLAPCLLVMICFGAFGPRQERFSFLAAIFFGFMTCSNRIFFGPIWNISPFDSSTSVRRNIRAVLTRVPWRGSEISCSLQTPSECKLRVACSSETWVCRIRTSHFSWLPKRMEGNTHPSFSGKSNTSFAAPSLLNTTRRNIQYTRNRPLNRLQKRYKWMKQKRKSWIFTLKKKKKKNESLFVPLFP